MIAYVLLTRFEVHDNSPSNPEADATVELATPARGITDAVTGPGSFINLRYQDFNVIKINSLDGPCRPGDRSCNAPDSDGQRAT
jgi:hypothetical protein